MFLWLIDWLILAYWLLSYQLPYPKSRDAKKDTILIVNLTHGNYIGMATLFQIDQATLHADNELTNTQLTVYLLAEQN